MARITLHCECCKKDFDLKKTGEIPAHVFKMYCNYCIECDFAGLMADEYEEWYDEYDDENQPNKPPSTIDDPNQLVMPFIFDELEIPKPNPLFTY